MKSKFVLWQPRCYNWLKNDKKIQVLENVQLLWISRNSLQTPSLDDILLVNFTLLKIIISVKDLIKWKRGFEIFLTDHYAGDIGNKDITVKY